MGWTVAIILYLLGAALNFNQGLVWDELGKFKRNNWLMLSWCVGWPFHAVAALLCYWISGGPMVRSMGERRD